MNTMIVSYDLGVPESGKDYAKLKEYMDTHLDWMKPLESFWILKTNKTAQVVRDELKNLTDSNDSVLVMDVSVHSWGSLRLSKNATDWLHEKIFSK